MKLKDIAVGHSFQIVSDPKHRLPIGWFEVLDHDINNTSIVVPLRSDGRSVALNSNTEVMVKEKPKAKFHVGQPVEYDSSDARCWCPAKIKKVEFSVEEGWTYEVSPDDLWCLESEIRELK